MISLRFFAVWIVFCAVSTQAQTLSREDRASGVNYLKRTRADILAATRGLSDAQWRFKPAPDRWSVAEVVEHIAASEDFLRDLIRDQVMKSPPPGDLVAQRAADVGIIPMVTDRSRRVQAPEPLRPDNRFGSPQAALKHFQASRARTLAFLKGTPDLRAHAMDNVVGQKLDAYQWLLFLAAHSERHTKQLLEVKAHPDFPSK